ncbi:MAG: hypothetical protein ACOC14_05895 [Bacillota bacterium]
MNKRIYILPLVLFIMVLSACGYKDYGGYTYQDFDHIDDWQDIDTVGDGDYEFLYIYDRDFKGTSCLGCDTVNEDLFKFAKEGDHEKSFTFINTREMTGSRPPHISDRAPILYIIKDEEVVDEYPSAREILEFIDTFEAGDYTWPEPSSDSE